MKEGHRRAGHIVSVCVYVFVCACMHEGNRKTEKCGDVARACVTTLSVENHLKCAPEFDNLKPDRFLIMTDVKILIDTHTNLTAEIGNEMLKCYEVYKKNSKRLKISCYL